MSKVAFVAEARGEFEEAAGGHPLVGVSGVCLFDLLCDADWTTRTEEDRSDLKDFWWFYHQWSNSGKPGERLTSLIEPRPMMRIWARRPNWFLTNVFDLRPENNDLGTLCVGKKEAPTGLPSIRAGKYINQEYLGELTRLSKQLLDNSTSLIVCLGGTATWAILHNPSISKLRGTVAPAVSLCPGKKVISCYHPAAILRQWELRHVTILDLMKAKRESKFHEIRRPKRKIYIPETIEDLYEIERWQSDGTIAPDIETRTDEITCFGFAGSNDRAVVIPITDDRKETGSYWKTFIEEKTAWDTIRSIAARPERKVFQNGLFDMNFCWTGYGITFAGDIDDTMLAHWAEQPESPKGLDFLGSVYTDELAWKLVRPYGKTTIKKED